VFVHDAPAVRRFRQAERQPQGILDGSIAFGAAAVQEAGAKGDVVARMNGKLAQRELSGPVS
jgi:hypothetical protein